jgi:gliding motility-associated protein GldE
LQNPDTSLIEALIPLSLFMQDPINGGILAAIIAMALLLICSALISGSETAFFSLNPVHLNNLKTEGSKKGEMTLSHLDRPKRLLASILIANNFVNVAIIILSTYISSEIFNFEANPIFAFFIQVVVITALILLFGEILPKVYATQYPDRFASFMTYPLLFLIRLFYPFSSLLVHSTRVIDKKISRKSGNISIDDLSEAINITADENTQEEERKILKGIVKFGDIEVKEIMKSRVDVVAVDSNTPFNDLINIIIDSGYSRIPAFKENFDNVQGLLYVKDLLPHIDHSGQFDWNSLLRPAFFVPENKKISALLEEFQEKKIHLAIVVDEYGGTSGIITLEDIIEEIVGDISDESDSLSDEILYSRIDKNNFLFEGKISLTDFCKVLDIDDREFENLRGESDSLAGLMLELKGKIPEKGEVIELEKYHFKIEAVDKRRIQKIRVRIIE